MNTDRELLEAAAKAAGLQLIEQRSGGLPWSVRCHDGLLRGWSPLTDDGDALRLAVKLNIGVLYSDFSGNAEARWDRGTHRIAEYGPDDPYAATRRAIVRAAAAIGANLERMTPTNKEPAQ